MDVSDGLVGDFAKLCRVSKVAAEIEAARVPLSDAAQAAVAADPAMLETALTGGDDFEIVCTVPAAKAEASAPRRKRPSRGDRDRRDQGRRGRPLRRTADGQALAFKRTSFSHF